MNIFQITRNPSPIPARRTFPIIPTIIILTGLALILPHSINSFSTTLIPPFRNGSSPTSTLSPRRKFDPPETPAPTVNDEWGGNCTDRHWEKCSKLETYFSRFVDKRDPKKRVQHHEIDCKIQPTLCLKNGWTVTRCQLLCMGKCNKDLMHKYDDYVVKKGQC